MTTSRSALTLTEPALGRLSELLGNDADSVALLGVKSRGCSGLSYNLTTIPASDIPKGAEVVRQGEITLAVEPSSLFYILGTVMDYEDTGLRAGFVFRNPNETGRCGCGESFSVAKQPPSLSSSSSPPSPPSAASQMQSS